MNEYVCYFPVVTVTLPGFQHPLRTNTALFVTATKPIGNGITSNGVIHSIGSSRQIKSAHIPHVAYRI